MNELRRVVYEQGVSKCDMVSFLSEPLFIFELLVLRLIGSGIFTICIGGGRYLYRRVIKVGCFFNYLEKVNMKVKITRNEKYEKLNTAQEKS